MGPFLFLKPFRKIVLKPVSVHHFHCIIKRAGCQEKTLEINADKSVITLDKSVIISYETVITLDTTVINREAHKSHFWLSAWYLFIMAK